jgi:hypothetical protein
MTRCFCPEGCRALGVHPRCPYLLFCGGYRGRKLRSHERPAATHGALATAPAIRKMMPPPHTRTHKKIENWRTGIAPAHRMAAAVLSSVLNLGQSIFYIFPLSVDLSDSDRVAAG